MISSETSDPVTLSRSYESLVALAAKSVVTVKAAAYRTASGVILPDNLIAVANHTIRRSDRIPVYSADGVAGEATLLVRDEGVDLAILRAVDFPASPLPHCDPASLKPGALAAVVGMTRDVGASASLGIIGAVGGARGTWRGGKLDQFLRLDVNLYPSQSGAAVVNASGELIGMATPALSRHAAIAVPAVTLARIAEQVMRDGGLRHGFIGVGVQPVAIQPSLSSRLELKQTAGLMLVSVEDGSPADKGGLQVGDILLELGGMWLREADELHAALRAAKIGSDLQFSILHGGQIEARTIVVGERPQKSK